MWPNEARTRGRKSLPCEGDLACHRLYDGRTNHALHCVPTFTPYTPSLLLSRHLLYSWYSGKTDLVLIAELVIVFVVTDYKHWKCKEIIKLLIFLCSLAGFRPLYSTTGLLAKTKFTAYHIFMKSRSESVKIPDNCNKVDIDFTNVMKLNVVCM